MASFPEIPSQLSPQQIQKWTKFLRNHNFSELWLWQYWKDDSRPQNQFNKKFLNRFSSKIRAQKEMKELVRHGIPTEHRGSLWWVCSGGAEKMKENNKQIKAGSFSSSSAYENYLHTALEVISTSPAAHDIMKDLHRTFVSLSGDVNEEGMIPLKNVLLAYSVRNKIVGYCQSMNFITAMLLMHLTEEQAFWVLAALVEDILPQNYYTTSMIGCRVDQAVFQSCLAWKLPRIFAHFKSKDMILEPITCSWFLCLYVNSLPLQDVLRIWDCVLWEGNVVLFRIGLAICRLMEPQILESQDFASMFSLLKKPLADTQFSGNDLMEAAFDKSWLGSIPRAKMEQLRDAHRQIIVRENEEINRMRQERALKASKSQNSLNNSFEDDDETTGQKEGHASQINENEHRRISSTYEGAEELLQRILHDEVILNHLSNSGEERDESIAPSSPGGDESATESTLDEEMSGTSPSPDSTIPAYQPPARRTSHIMMSFLTEDLNTSSLAIDALSTS